MGSLAEDVLNRFGWEHPEAVVEQPRPEGGKAIEEQQRRRVAQLQEQDKPVQGSSREPEQAAQEADDGTDIARYGAAGFALQRVRSRS